MIGRKSVVIPRASPKACFCDHQIITASFIQTRTTNDDTLLASLSMLKPKTKGLFVDISEYSVLAARTSGYKLPMVVEEIKELPLSGSESADDIRDFLEGIVDFKGAAYHVARCGVYPEGRFVRFYEVESPAKAKDLSYLVEVLRNELNVDPETNQVSILNAYDGSDYDGESGVSKRLIYCGGPAESFESEQSRILDCGLYPDRMELSSVTTLGGVCDYSRFNNLKAPILCLELTSRSASIFIQSNGHVEVARPIPYGLDSIYPLLQRELGLKDEESARKLFFSNTFDFAEMGPKLLRRITKELQASAGFYEVQTGQTIDQVFISVLPKNLSWIAKTVSDALGLELLRPNYEAWMESLNVKMADDVELANLGSRWMSLFSLMGEYHLREEVASE